MRIQVKKWGNSLALRIPKAFAQEAKIDQGSILNLSVENGKLIITPVSELEYTLEELLAGITEHNLPGEVDTGYAVGKEIW